MAFEKLQSLGTDKFGKITNWLMLGKPALSLARTIQTEWGDFPNVQEKTLTQMLNRLRLSMVEGTYGEEAAKHLKEHGKVDIKMLRGSSLDVLGELVMLAAVQRERVQYLLEKEKEIKLPMTGLSTLINDFRDLLLATQKVQFDLGVDEFKGPVTSTHGVRKQLDVETSPDGTRRERHMFESVTQLDEIFKRRGVPELAATEDAQ